MYVANIPPMNRTMYGSSFFKIQERLQGMTRMITARIILHKSISVP